MGDDHKLKLLLVDDEFEFLQAATAALGRRGFIVTQAKDGSVALEAVDKDVFDVVVLDVKMPGIDGVEVFQELTRLVPDLPVVMLTGHGNIEQAFETSRHGVFEYLTKPCDMDRLAQVLRNAAGQRNSMSLVEDFDEEVRLLHADDELDFVEALAPALERRNIRVTTAMRGDEAIEIAAQQPFDVALLDVRMPGLDGLAVLKHLKATNPLIEVIVLTGHPSMKDAMFGMRQGAFDFLTKPQPVDVLITRIRAAFGRAQDKRKQREESQIQEILERQPD